MVLGDFNNLDLRLLFDLNSMISHSSLGSRILNFIGGNPLFRGIPVFFPMMVLWFSSECKKRRSRMLVGLLATCAATVLSVWLQGHMVTHVRPFLDARLHLNGIDPIWTMNWDRVDSFPSDTSTLFFCLATVIYLEHRMAGGIAFVWTLVIVSATRVAMGWHYPSDIAGALVLGTASVYFPTRIRPLLAFAERQLQRCDPYIYIVHAVLFLFLADAYTLFAGLQGFYHGFRIIGARLAGLI
jgi:undecaprenyl-diphosphatase